MSDELSGNIRRMVPDDLERVLAWRNHPEVRKYMYTQHEISLAEHARWFERASQDARKHLLIVERNGDALGFVNFSLAGAAAIADWGFYVSPDAPGGSGRLLGQTALAHAFGPLALHKVCGQALAYNERSIRFHLRQGFQQEGVLRHQHYDGQSYHDVVCFGLLASEWPLPT